MAKWNVVAAIAAIVAGGAAASSEVEAATRFGVVCIINETNANIGYQIKIGDGPWENFKMAPRQSRWFSHKYDALNENASPKLMIRYDSDVRVGKNFTVEHTLTRLAAVGESCKEGAQYVFHYEKANRNFILLYKRK